MQRAISPVHAEHTASNNTLLQKPVNSSLKMVIYSFQFYYGSFIFPPLKHVKTLRTGDADLRFYITTVQDG